VDTPEGAKMREELFMARRKRRQFTPEFKAEAVRLTRVGDRSIAQVATDLDLTETALREWVKRADADEGSREVARASIGDYIEHFYVSPPASACRSA
jgi:transposase-like protein